MSELAIFNRVFIGYDGSKNSQDIISVFRRLQPKLEASTIAFVWDPMKNYIPPTARGPGIQKQIRQKVQGLTNIEVKIIAKQQDISERKSTNQYLLNEYLKSKSSFIMLGFYGSKGEKVRSIDLSSRVRQFVYDSKFPVAIVKRSNENLDKILFCCDGSQVSYQGLKKASGFCKKFGFNLSILHAYSEETKNYSKQVKSQLKVYQDSLAQSSKIQIIVQKCNLLEYLGKNGSNYEWVIVTKNGYRGQITKKSFIGSNTTEILTKINSNLIIL